MEDNRCLNMSVAREAFDNWTLLTAEQYEKLKRMKDLENRNNDGEYYFEIYKIIEKSNDADKDTINEFLIRHPLIKEISELSKEIDEIEIKIKNELNKPICNEYSQFTLINDPNNEGETILVDLKTFNKLKINNLSPFFKEFIIKALSIQGCYIDITKDIRTLDINDLPLLMAIKEDLELKREEITAPDKNYKNVYTGEFKYWGEEGLAHEIGIEYVKAKLMDLYYIQGLANPKNKTISSMDANLSIKLPFIFDSNEIQNKWRELDIKQKQLPYNEYCVEYYKLLMLFGNSIEKIYLDAPDEEKGYVIDAYYYYSSETMNMPRDRKEEEKLHFRTSSSIVNQEVLKRKVMKK